MRFFLYFFSRSFFLRGKVGIDGAKGHCKADLLQYERGGMSQHERGGMSQYEKGVEIHTESVLRFSMRDGSLLQYEIGVVFSMELDWISVRFSAVFQYENG